MEQAALQAALRAELADDPLGRGYAGMNDAEAAVSLNGATRPLGVVSSDDIARYILEEGLWPKVEDLAAGGGTANQKAAARTALALMRDVKLPSVRLKRPKVQAMLDLLVAGGAMTAGDKAALNALADDRLSRAAEIGIDRAVDAGDVSRARALA